MDNMFFRALLIVILFSLSAFAGPVSLSLPDSLMALSEEVTRLTMSLRYDDALATAKRIRKADEGVGCIIENVVRISLFDDCGDTLSLQHAGRELEECKSTGMWDALRKFELGYVQVEMGRSVAGAMTTRSAAKLFEESRDLDARAFYAIYAYYMDKLFSWVPFKSDRRAEYLAVLDSASAKSERFWPLFLTSLAWMYYDKEDFNTGLKFLQRGLGKAPGHPVLLQLRADMLYRLKRYGEAAQIYEASAVDYMKRTGKSIRYWCSVLNLIRIYHDSGDKARAAEWRAKLKDPVYESMKSWMPESLMDDLNSRSLL